MEINVSHQLRDPLWDTFLESIPRSHYLQSSLWAQVSNKVGWQCLRATFKQDAQIVAGFQMLIRPVSVFGNIGYIPRGPVLIDDSAELIDLVIKQIYQLSKSNRVIYFKVQPDYNGEKFAAHLAQAHYWPSEAHADNVATVLIDLTQDETHLMSNLRKSLRKSIRRAERKGVVIRWGDEQDLDIFYRILHQTSQRGQFAIHNESYYQEVWQRFTPAGHTALLIAECEKEPVAVLFLILFGNTAYARFGGWDGRYAKHEPNSLLRWTAIRWAREHGYHWYDFMGIDERLARSLLQDPPDMKPKDIGGYTAFKLGFGGQISISPGTYDHFSQPLLAKGFKWLQKKPALRDRLLNFVRGAKHTG